MNAQNYIMRQCILLWPPHSNTIQIVKFNFILIPKIDIGIHNLTLMNE